MSEALIGCKKGDKVWIGLPSTKASTGSMNFSDRQRPNTWIFMEIEVIKVKNSDDKKKKDKKSKSKDSEPNEQALTIVGDQEARSYYLDSTLLRLQLLHIIFQIQLKHKIIQIHLVTMLGCRLQILFNYNRIWSIYKML